MCQSSDSEAPHHQNSEMSKRTNSACHFCDHAARRPGRQSIALQVACSAPNCRKVYCSRPSCWQKLPQWIKTECDNSFAEFKHKAENNIIQFVCPHCADDRTCPGPQCHRRWMKRQKKKSYAEEECCSVSDSRGEESPVGREIQISSQIEPHSVDVSFAMTMLLLKEGRGLKSEDNCGSAFTSRSPTPSLYEPEDNVKLKMSPKPVKTFQPTVIIQNSTYSG